MAWLYYLITLPTERFGHFCDVSDGYKYLRFVHRSDDSVLATAESLPSQTDDSVSLAGYCKRHVRPRGRLAHVFRTTYKGNDAFLKLSWTPVDRMPEGAVYDILRRTGVDGIPLVLASGLLKEDLFGYRLEYLVLEDCGSSVAEYLKLKHSDGLHSNELGSQVMNIVRATLRCLVQARVKGNVLHRDVSMGNIMVGSGGAVKVIDWGYAKVIDEDSLDSGDASTTGNWGRLLEETALRWRYASKVVLRNEKAHDPLTGTPLYMSIPVLAGAKVRGLADDIESLLYVVMDALSELQPKKDDVACGFETHDHRMQAMIRVGCLSSVEIFPRFFGISSCSDKLRQLLRDLRGFLFVNSSGYIASDLIVDPSTERGTAVELLKDYADHDTMTLLGHREAFTPRKSARQIPSTESRSESSSNDTDQRQCLDGLDGSGLPGSSTKPARARSVDSDFDDVEIVPIQGVSELSVSGLSPKAHGKMPAPSEAAEESDVDPPTPAPKKRRRK
ncbi:hypothetical protein IWW47_004246 [Coemansia sp. RSA 2052]|nr:hypothetical protein IWW47_004246 [Coemansia sp. RSA 2052]